MKLIRTILCVSLIATISMACNDKPKCKADFESCKKVMTESALCVWDCVDKSKSKIDLEKCEDKKKEVNYPVEENL